MEIERRKVERIPCYMIVQRSSQENEEEDFFGVVRNISAGGAMIETEFPVEIGGVLDLAFLMEEDRQIWEGRGRVVWARQIDAKTIFGLQFTKPLEENWTHTMQS